MGESVNYKHILVLLSLCICIIPASAYYEVHPGDVVYQDEIVDISRVLSFSGQFAYFNSGYYGTTPDKIVNFHDRGFMYAYQIKKEEYYVGTWYKWDGYEPASYSLAFVVRAGVRSNITDNQTPAPGTTPTVTPTPVPPAHVIPQQTHLLIVRGDTGTLEYGYQYNRPTTKDEKAYLWLFGTKGDYDLSRGSPIKTGSIMGVPMKYTSNDSIHSYEFTREHSQSLSEGWYTGYIQFLGNDKRQEVFYDPVKNNLDSPYKAVPEVNLDSFIPLRYQQELERMGKPSEYCDDVFIPITVEIVRPAITIGEYWEESDDIIVEGTTPFSEGTPISVIVDPDNFALTYDIQTHTYYTKATTNPLLGTSIIENETKYIDANGNPIQKGKSVWRTYSIRIPIKWDEMKLGEHTIRASIDSYGVKSVMNKDFSVTGKWVNPEPTKEFRKVVVGEYGSHSINVDTGKNMNSTGFPIQVAVVTPIKTPNVTQTISRPNVVRNQSADNSSNLIVFTQPPTPAPPTPKPTPTDDVVIPVNPLVGIGAVLVAGYIAYRKR